MGTEVASRPPLPPGLNVGSNSHGPGPGPGPGRKRRERERDQTFMSSGSVNSGPTRIYSRDYQLRIQGQKYNLATAFVCIGAKIHHRFSPSHDHNGQKYTQSQEHNLQFAQYTSLEVPRQAQHLHLPRNKDIYSQDSVKKRYEYSRECSTLLDLEVSEYNQTKSNSLDLDIQYLESQHILDYSKYVTRYV